MKTLTIDEAIELVPAIGAKEPKTNVSERYQFVSTKEILNQVHNKGWRITNATSQGQSIHSQHRVTLVHETSLNDYSNNDDGIMRIELFNSHNRTKRLMFAIGYFRLVCSNGLIVAAGPAETIKTKHSINSRTSLLDNLSDRIEQLTENFPVISKKINNLKSRMLTTQEQEAFAKFAIKGRYLYRSQLPKRFSNLDESSFRVLESRREADQGDSAWVVYNRIQENIVRGIQNFSQPIKSYSDNIRVNTLLWKGADASLECSNENLRTTLEKFLVKRN